MKDNCFYTGNLDSYILREYNNILDGLECGKEVNLSKLKKAIDIKKIIYISKTSEMTLDCMLPNLANYLSYYK